jgi:PIN domain
MNIYVESNFILEMALRQEQYQSCENIIAICETKRAQLIVPAYCIVEPYATIRSFENKRQSIINGGVRDELKQLSRSEAYRDDANTLLQNLTSLLIQSIEGEKRILRQTIDKILSAAEVIPLEQNILAAAVEFESSLNLSPQDSVVYASIVSHLSTSSLEEKCFLNRNSRDFDTPDIVEALDNYGCKMLFSFNIGYNYIQSQIRE